MPGTGSGSGYDSTADRAQAQTKKAAGELTDDMEMEHEGAAEEASATAKEDEILEPWQRDRAVKEMKDNPGR